jgi:hypothetical protein
MLLADVTLCCGMYPAGKVDISRHLAILGFHQSDHTVGKLSSVQMLVYCVVTSSHPQMSASHLLRLQGLQQTPVKIHLTMQKMWALVNLKYNKNFRCLG